MATEKVNAEEQIVETEVKASAKPSRKRTSSQTKKAAQASEPKQEKAFVPKNIDDSQYVTVVNGFHGILVYRSRKTGEEFVWDKYGDEQEMELRELKNAKSSAKAFFENNWFMFNEKWIIDYLGVGRLYKNAIDIDSFDSIFNKSPNEIKNIVSEMKRGQKSSLAYRAKELITEGKIDSLKTITALEESLGIELIEH